MTTILLWALLAAQPAPVPAQEGPEIVVTGTRAGKCRVSLAGKVGTLYRS